MCNLNLQGMAYLFEMDNMTCDIAFRPDQTVFDMHSNNTYGSMDDDKQTHRQTGRKRRTLSSSPEREVDLIRYAQSISINREQTVEHKTKFPSHSSSVLTTLIPN